MGSLAAKGPEIADVIAGFADAGPEAGLRQLALAASRHPGAAGRPGDLLVPRPVAECGHRPPGVAGAATSSRPPRPAAVDLPAFDWAAHVPDGTGHRVVPEDRCHRILAAAGLPVAAGRLVADAAEAIEAALALGFPVVLKGISPSVTHRAAAGLLAVDLRTARKSRLPVGGCGRAPASSRIELDGIYVQEMHRGGTELLLAAFRDPMFGVMVSCGSGGGSPS